MRTFTVSCTVTAEIKAESINQAAEKVADLSIYDLIEDHSAEIGDFIVASDDPSEPAITL